MSAIHRSELPATTRPASARATGLGLISRRAAIATLAGSALLMLAGCSSSDGADAATASVQPRNMVVALGTGARANTPALTSLPAQLTDAIAATVETGGAFDLIVIDGDPRPLGAATLASAAKTDSSTDAAARRARSPAGWPYRSLISLKWSISTMTK